MIYNFSLIKVDKDLNEINNYIVNEYKISNILEIENMIEGQNSVSKIASFAKTIIEFANIGNDVFR